MNQLIADMREWVMTDPERRKARINVRKEGLLLGLTISMRELFDCMDVQSQRVVTWAAIDASCAVLNLTLLRLADEVERAAIKRLTELSLES